MRGFSRPGARADGWSRAGILAGPVVVAITPEHYNRMYRILKRDIPVTVEIEVRNRIGEVVEQAVNITGDIPGSDLKDEVVMLGAHFDTWHASPNASDNTSGVAVALEAMRILKAVGARPRRTIRVALWSGEEQGLFGLARLRAAALRQSPRLHGRREAGVREALGLLQPGLRARPVPRHLPAGERAARALLAAWMEPFRDFGMTVVSNQSVGSTDHVSFDEVGLPGFQFLQDRVPGTGGHTNLDFYDTIQARGPDEERGRHGLVRLPRGDGADDGAEEAIEVGWGGYASGFDITTRWTGCLSLDWAGKGVVPVARNPNLA